MAELSMAGGGGPVIRAGDLVELDGWRMMSLSASRPAAIHESGIPLSKGERALVVERVEGDNLPDVLLLTSGGRTGWMYSGYLRALSTRFEEEAEELSSTCG